MPDKSDNPFKFWEELKRRKVFRVVAMYAGTAFIIMEAAEIMLPRLGLPDWIVTFIIVLLIIGFPIAVILSWIFDLTPEGVKKTESFEEAKKQELPSEPIRRKLRIGDIIIVVLIVVVGILAYPKIFKKDKLQGVRDDDGRISVAVMPFQNLTNDTIWDIWQSGIQFSLISSLSNSTELKVRQTKPINTILKSDGLTNFASLTPNIARRTSQKLDANIFIYGNVMQAGPNIRINAQLIDSQTEDIYKSFQIDATPENVLFIVDSLSSRIMNFLIISELSKESPLYDGFSRSGKIEMLSSDSPEAYRYNIQGLIAFYDTDYPTAERFFLEAIKIDSNLIQAISFLSLTYLNQGSFDQGKKWCLIAYEKRDQMTMYHKFFVNWLYAGFFETQRESIAWIKQILQIDEQQPGWYYVLGNAYYHFYQYDNAILAFERALEIYDKWGSKPLWAPNYFFLGMAYHKTGNFKKGKKLYERAEQDFPDNTAILHNQAILSLSDGDTVAANQFIEKFISLHKDNSTPEAFIVTYLAYIYSDSEILDKAEEYYRKALSLEPENPVRMNNLAYFLIDKNRDTNAGLDLINSALEFGPDNFNFLHTKAWGLYKQANYEEAQKFINKTDSLKPIYIHEIFLHKQEIEKAIASQ